jgi:hypothetical protein
MNTIIPHYKNQVKYVLLIILSFLSLTPTHATEFNLKGRKILLSEKGNYRFYAPRSTLKDTILISDRKEKKVIGFLSLSFARTQNERDKACMTAAPQVMPRGVSLIKQELVDDQHIFCEVSGLSPSSGFVMIDSKSKKNQSIAPVIFLNFMKSDQAFISKLELFNLIKGISL